MTVATIKTSPCGGVFGVVQMSFTDVYVQLKPVSTEHISEQPSSL
jgi:hypothetical protein